jgi:hypothetical protein
MTEFSQDYLNGIKDVFKRMDDVKNGGNGDGKVNIKEAFNDLAVASLFDGMKKGSSDYNKLKDATANISDILKDYAGDDGEFSAQEWAEFLNGEEWGNVIDTYHSSEAWSKIEMDWVDNSDGMIKDGKVTKGEVKVGLADDLIQRGYDDVDTSSLDELIDKYAGEDGTFTTKEYTAMRNDSLYKAFVDKYGIVPFHINDDKNEE